MKLLEKIDNYIKVSEYLGEENATTLLNNLKELAYGGRFYLPFIGQFSAGKSKLINRILGEPVLPVKAIETTAFLTYIEFSELKHARLDYMDGTSEDIPIEDVKKLDNQSLSTKRPIAALHICYPLELLRNGLVLVDTPGLDTLVKQHVDTTEALLENALHVVYVMSRPLSSFDENMLKRIEALSIPVILVRTHVDEINRDEEDPIETLSNEKTIIEKKLGHAIDTIYTLCNDSDSNEFGLWQGWFEMLNQYLQIGIAASAQEVFEATIEARMDTLKNKLESGLILRKENQVKASGKSDSELNSQKIKIESELERLEHEKQKYQRKLSEDANKVLSDIDLVIKSKKNKAIGAFDEIINNSDDLRTDIEHQFNVQLLKELDSIGDAASDKIEEWTRNKIEDSKEELSKIKLSFDEIDASFSANFSIDTLQEYSVEYKAKIEECEKQMEALNALRLQGKKKLVELGASEKECSDLLDQIDEIIEVNRTEINDEKSGHEVATIDYDSKLGPIMKKVGIAMDLAMLLIPGPTWAAAGTKIAATGGKLVAHGGKVAAAAGHTMNAIGKGVNVMSKIDKTLDVVKIIDGGTKTIKGSKTIKDLSSSVELAKNAPEYLKGVKKRASVFDYLSLSYWMGKAGEAIDPSRKVVDTAEENAFHIKISQMESQMKANVQARLAQETKLGILKSQAEKQHRYDELYEQELSRLNAEKVELEQKYQRNSEAKRIELYKEESRKQYSSRIEEYTIVIRRRSAETLSTLVEQISYSTAQYASDQLEDMRKQIEEIEDRRAAGINDNAAILSEIETYTSMLSA